MVGSLASFLRIILLVIGALFPIVNPLGTAPIFLSMTQGFSTGVRTALSMRIAINGFLLLVVSLLIGTNILDFFGISIPVVQVGGGMVVMATGWRLLNRRDDEEGGSVSRGMGRTEISNQAFYPLTLPLTVGPGSISVAITVGANAPHAIEAKGSYLAAALVGAAVVSVGVYFSYRFAERLAEALGETAMKVILRLSSFILLCIGVQIAWNGLSVLLRSTQ